MIFSHTFSVISMLYGLEARICNPLYMYRYIKHIKCISNKPSVSVINQEYLSTGHALVHVHTPVLSLATVPLGEHIPYIGSGVDTIVPPSSPQLK